MDNKFRVVVGRFDPIHDGHINLINHCLERSGEDNTLILVGSPNAHVVNYTPEWENKKPMFGYQDRVGFIRKALPLHSYLRIAPIPDMFDPELWYLAFTQLIDLAFPDMTYAYDPRLKIVVGEKAEMVYDKVYKDHFHEDVIEVVDRTLTGISATNVRKALIGNECLADMIKDPILRKTIELRWRQMNA